MIGRTARGPLAQRFIQFAAEARRYEGPLYEVLSRQTALDEELLDVACHVRRPPVPNVFFAAVHFLLTEQPQHALSSFYGSLSERPRPAADAPPAFRDFVLANKAGLFPLLDTRITQTNEVSRCSFLVPAFTLLHQRLGRPLSLIDVGCSAGLHLIWDRYHYDYGGREVGDARASVSISCQLRGPLMPPLPGRFPECSFRVGIDLSPVDLSDTVERRWFYALIWPDHGPRRRLAAAAAAELLRNPPEMVKGNAVDVLESQLRRAPPDSSLVLYNSAALCQGGPEDEHAIARVLMACSSGRPLQWLHCEGEEMLLRTVDGGSIVEEKLANKDGHGRWLEWLA